MPVVVVSPNGGKSSLQLCLADSVADLRLYLVSTLGLRQALRLRPPRLEPACLAAALYLAWRPLLTAATLPVPQADSLPTSFFTCYRLKLDGVWLSDSVQLSGYNAELTETSELEMVPDAYDDRSVSAALWPLARLRLSLLARARCTQPLTSGRLPSHSHGRMCGDCGSCCLGRTFRSTRPTRSWRRRRRTRCRTTSRRAAPWRSRCSRACSSHRCVSC